MPQSRSLTHSRQSITFTLCTESPTRRSQVLQITPHDKPFSGLKPLKVLPNACKHSAIRSLAQPYAYKQNLGTPHRHPWTNGFDNELYWNAQNSGLHTKDETG